MAAPTPTHDIINYDGYKGCIRWLAKWTAGAADNFADQSLVDLSADLAPAPSSVKIRYIDAILNGDLGVVLEFDATTDQRIDEFLGQTDATYQVFRDYEDSPGGGIKPSDTTATGFTGDILLTTTNAADGDELNLFIIFEKSS